MSSCSIQGKRKLNPQRFPLVKVHRVARSFPCREHVYHLTDIRLCALHELVHNVGGNLHLLPVKSLVRHILTAKKDADGLVGNGKYSRPHSHRIGSGGSLSSVHSCVKKGISDQLSKREAKSSILEGFQLLRALIVRDADDGDLCLLNQRVHGADAAPVACRHSVHLIHNQARPVRDRNPSRVRRLYS